MPAVSCAKAPYGAQIFRGFPVINAAFTPSLEEVTHAEEIVAAFEAQPDAGVLSVGGRMIDRPHLVQARRVLERAARE